MTSQTAAERLGDIPRPVTNGQGWPWERRKLVVRKPIRDRTSRVPPHLGPCVAVSSALEARLSYQLAFWKTNRRIDPADVYTKISDGKRVRGLKKLDSFVVERQLVAAFPGWAVDASLATTASQTAISRAESALDVSYTPQSVLFACYGLSNEDLNRIIDIMHAMGLPLYDPQTRERFG